MPKRIVETPRKKKRNKGKLPNKIIPLENADKLWHEKWTPRRNMLNLVHPWRGVFIARPNLGKSTTVKNILIRAKPAFEKVIVIHADFENTKEYECIGTEEDGVHLIGHIPSPDEYDENIKTLVIIDDIELKSLSKEQFKCLSRLVGYVSTHKNCSVAICQQDCFSIPPIVRRCANLWVLWRSTDMDSFASIARKAGLQRSELLTIFDNLMTNDRDSLWIDLTSKTPYPLRKNGFEIIEKN